MRKASRSPDHAKRATLKAIASGISAAGLSSLFPLPAIAQPRTIKYTLSWLPTGQYAFVYMARQLGFWKRRGLDVEITRGYGSLAAIQGVATGQFDIGGAATSANLLSILKGLEIWMVSTQGYDSSMGILVPAKGPIKTPKDLEGKKIGVTAAGGDTPFLPAYYKLAGVDPAKITTVSLDSQIIEQSVISGLVDCMVAFGMSSIPNFITQNFPIRLMPFQDVGLKFYWVNTIVRTELVNKEPQLVTELTEGLFEGFRFAMLNPEETVERHLKEHPEIGMTPNGRLFTELGVGMVTVSATAEESERHSLGFSDLGKVGKMADVVKEFTAPDAKGPPVVDSYCSNKFIGNVTLTADQWAKVKQTSAKYAQMLGRA
jgi:NitT/TauT family transport system substrate-binding protein